MKMFRRYSRRVILAARPLRDSVRLSTSLDASPTLRRHSGQRKSPKSSPGKSSPPVRAVANSPVKSSPKRRLPPSRDVRRQLNFGRRDSGEDGTTHYDVNTTVDNVANASARNQQNAAPKDASAPPSLSRSDTITANGFDSSAAQQQALDLLVNSGITDARDIPSNDVQNEATRSPVDCGLTEEKATRQNSALQAKSSQLNTELQEGEAKLGSALSRNASELSRNGSNLSRTGSNLGSSILQNESSVDSTPSGLDRQGSEIDLRTSEVIPASFSLLNPFNSTQTGGAPAEMTSPIGDKENEPPTPAPAGFLNALGLADPWSLSGFGYQQTV